MLAWLVSLPAYYAMDSCCELQELEPYISWPAPRFNLRKRGDLKQHFLIYGVYGVSCCRLMTMGIKTGQFVNLEQTFFMESHGLRMLPMICAR